MSKTPSSCFSTNLFFLLLLVWLVTNFFFLVNFLTYFYMNGVPVILSFRARNKNCVERLRTLHPDNFSSFRILSSQRILSGHLILIPSALRNYSIMGHYSPGTISFLQILREDCPTIGKVKKVNLCSNTVWKRSRITAPIVGILWHRGIWEGFIRFYCIKARPGGLPGLHTAIRNKYERRISWIQKVGVLIFYGSPS